MKRATVVLSCCLLMSIGLVALLFNLSDYLTHQRGGFLRLYPPHPILREKGLKLDMTDSYVAGGDGEALYIASKRRPFRVVKIQVPSMDTCSYDLNLGIAGLKTYSSVLKIDSPYFYLFDGAMPFIYQGNTLDWSGSPRSVDTYFVDLVPIGDASFAIRSYSLTDRMNVLGRLRFTEPRFTLRRGLLEKQVDGYFCTDGMLRFNRDTRQVVYTYYYRNEFIVMDTLVNLQYRENTIDTISVARVKSALLDQTGQASYRLSGPPPFVNKASAVFDDYLLVHSTSASTNENMSQFRKAAAIDVYSLSKHSYLFSFYLYHEEGESLRNFYVFGDYLFGIYDHFIARYSLNHSKFKRMHQ
jgi:hypothetical protein